MTDNMTFCIKSGGVIFSRIIPGGIQLLHSPLRERGVHQNANVCETGEGGGENVSANVCLQIYERFI